MSTKVEVRPLDKEKWHGKKGKESFSQPHTTQALADTETMQYAVVISQEDEDFFLKKKIKYDLSLHFDPESPHPFWDSGSAKVKLENRTMFFNKAVPLERIKVCIMKGNRFIANSKKEADEGFWPDATHYIHDESEEAELKASKVTLKNTAVIEVSKLSRERKISVVKVLTGGNLKSSTENFITVEMDKLISKDPELLLRTINRGKKEISVLALVYEAVDKGVLRKDGHKIKHLDSVLGMDEEEVAEYLGKDENQDFYLILKEKTQK